jgi:2-succinyl-5-enolpyruvyl-6-hydroxy-3-cyclohexene-1-carboxylate synthase
VAARAAGPTVLLVGDVALAHDAGALLTASRLGVDLTIILLDNGGGGIFDFLPVAGEADVFEEHVATPTGLDFAAVAAAYGCRHIAVADPAALEKALDEELAAPGTAILHVHTDRAENVALHREVWRAVAAAI